MVSARLCNHCVFMKKFGDNDFIILLLYMDDMLIAGQDVSRIDHMKRELSKSFAMKNLGPVKYILGMKISRNRKLGSYSYLKKDMLKELLKDLTWARQNMFALHLQAILSLVLSIVLQVRKRSKR